jgi:integrase
LIAKYLQVKRKHWTAKTYKGRERQLAYVAEFLGQNRAVASVKAADIREYRDAVLRLRTNHHVGAGKSFLARQTENPTQRIQTKTASVVFEACKALFRWAKSDAYIDANPAADIQLNAPKKVKGEKPRRPFTAAELETLFGSPLYRGCQSRQRRHIPGTLVIEDARYWVPILGYLTGMRLGEIVQMHISDIHLDGPVPFIEVTDANGGELGSGDEKHVKSDAGVRKVPLHPHVFVLGFAKFVQTRRLQKRARLFHEVKYGADGQPSTVFSKWFAGFLDKAKLGDPALVFHSFRHTAEDAFRDALQPQYVIDQIIGHTDGATSAGYGQGVSLEVAYEAVKAMKLKVDIVQLLKGHDSEG